MKVGDKSVIYKHGNIGEANEHFGIPRFDGTFLTKQWKWCDKVDVLWT